MPIEIRELVIKATVNQDQNKAALDNTSTGGTDACDENGAWVREAVEERNSSSDLTHYRTVKKGDTLPLMCYRIYGHSKYYWQIAKVNGLSNFRELQPDNELFFPPIEKVIQ